MEGFGISVIEAASCKIPVVAANLEGLKDAIKENQNGFLVETEDVDGYLSKINALLADENYRKSFGEKARQFVIDHFQWDAIAQEYLTEIRKTIEISKR